MENIDNDENEPDRIDSLEDNGRALEDEEIHHSPPLINLNLLQGAHLIEGYEYCSIPQITIITYQELMPTCASHKTMLSKHWMA